ncbi:MAG: hypothetical protein JNM81_03080 [Rhodospirillaceae bacterium]|nr:hypothetical protein [Rhodospirillaceae bacterium]
MTEYCEKTFATTMLLESFRKLALRTCKMPHWVELEGRDRSHAPNTLFISVVFCNVEERDRFAIAFRFAEEELSELAKKPAEPKSSPRRTAADTYAVV